MTQTIDRAADAILALINSRPSSPTRAEIASIIAAVRTPALAPTELGRELMARIPAYIVALSRIDDFVDDPEKSRAFEETASRTKEIVNAILARPVTSPADLVDLAIVARFQGCDEHYSVNKLEDDDAAHVTIVRFLLEAAGVPEAECSIGNPAFAALFA